jgi:hypothetical protein
VYWPSRIPRARVVRAAPAPDRGPSSCPLPRPSIHLAARQRAARQRQIHRVPGLGERPHPPGNGHDHWLRDRHAGRLHAGLRGADTPRAQYRANNRLTDGITTYVGAVFRSPPKRVARRSVGAQAYAASRRIFIPASQFAIRFQPAMVWSTRSLPSLGRRGPSACREPRVGSNPSRYDARPNRCTQSDHPVRGQVVRAYDFGRLMGGTTPLAR